MQITTALRNSLTPTNLLSDSIDFDDICSGDSGVCDKVQK